jgi:hypothetical protein
VRSSEKISPREVLRAFFTSSKEHWKELVGGSAVALLIGVGAAVGLNISAGIAAALAFGVAVVVACWLAFKDQYSKVLALEERLEPRITISCSDDEQCKLAAGERNSPHFRVRIHLSGDKIAEKVTATIIGIREDGRKLPVTEPVKLRFHSAGIELPILRPGSVELLDMFRIDPEGVSISVVIDYGAFNRFCCNNLGRTYEIDVEIASTLMPARFTYIFPWTGDFNTTNPHVKLRPLVNRPSPQFFQRAQKF